MDSRSSGQDDHDATMPTSGAPAVGAHVATGEVDADEADERRAQQGAVDDAPAHRAEEQLTEEEEAADVQQDGDEDGDDEGAERQARR